MGIAHSGICIRWVHRYNISYTEFRSDQVYVCVDSAGANTSAVVISTNVILCDIPALRVGTFGIKIQLVLFMQSYTIGNVVLEYKSSFLIKATTVTTLSGVMTLNITLNRPISLPACLFPNLIRIRATFILPSMSISCSFPVAYFGRPLYIVEESTLLARQFDFELISS